MNTNLQHHLARWTTDELVAEVFKRNAGNRTALRALQATVLQALLSERDRTMDREGQRSLNGVGQ